MLASQGNWTQTAGGLWQDRNTGFTTFIDPHYAPPNIALPDVSQGQQDYNRWEQQRNAYRQAAGTYVTKAESDAGKPIFGAEVDRLFSPDNPYPGPNAGQTPPAGAAPQAPPPQPGPAPTAMAPAGTPNNPLTDQLSWQTLLGQYGQPTTGTQGAAQGPTMLPGATGVPQTASGLVQANPMQGQPILGQTPTVPQGFNPYGGGVTAPTGPGYTSNATPGNAYGLIDAGEFQPYGVPTFKMDAPPMMPTQFSPEFNAQYFGAAGNLADQVKQAYNYDPYHAQAASINQVPMASANQFGISPQLAQLLSGQGFDPATLAKMQAASSEQVGQTGAEELAAAKTALNQAGLFGSPAGAAIQADVARQSGQQQQEAQRAIDIANAQQGMQNLQFGVGQQTNIGLSNMQQANAMALANANRLFDAMAKNAGFTQEANINYATAKQGQQAGQAGGQAKVLGDFGNTWATGATNQFGTGTQANVQNLWDWIQKNTGLAANAAGTNAGQLQDLTKTALNQFGQGFSPNVNV